MHPHEETELALVIDFEAHRPVWRVARERCRTCDYTAICVVHVDGPHDASQCAHCMQMTAVVTHWEVGTGSEGEPLWEPRVTEETHGNVVRLCH